MATHFIYSFVVDAGARFPYQAWHLAHSLVRHCSASTRDIHVQCTPEVDARTRTIFSDAGFIVHEIGRFGDGRYCNKLNQLDSLASFPFDVAILLDTDTIAVSDLRPWISTEAITGKIVDAENPLLSTLREIAKTAGTNPGEPVPTDNGIGSTFEGNCNGGMYSVPRAFCEVLSSHWKRAALWLLGENDALQRAGKAEHVDQVSFWLALRQTGLPFKRAAANVNYFVHVDGAHIYHEPTEPISLLHYHNSALNVLGAIEAPQQSLSDATKAIATANAEMACSFNNELFWNYRYDLWPERGSGIGSRGENLSYKRHLLTEVGISDANSVLDIGCGDMEVIRNFRLSQYTGLDLSPVALARGREIFPHGRFYLGLPQDLEQAEIVLCFEVLIHQQSRDDYNELVSYAAAHASKSLIISGYEQETDAIRLNPMVFFHEPLSQSLQRIGYFSSIEKIGAHTDVNIYRCNV